MMTKFNPKEHLIDLRGKSYLPVNKRLVWFREDHPNGSIQTDVVNYAPLVVQARVYNGDGVLLATGHGSANIAQGKTVVWSGREIEKAETAAIGRALGHAGFGTQFDNDDDDLENLADSPLEVVAKNAPQSHQEGATADLPKAAGDYEPRTPKQALNGNGPAERTVTANSDKPANGKQGYKDGDLMNAVLKTVYSNNPIHMKKSLKKLNDEGKLGPWLTLDEAVEVVKNRHANKAKDVPA